MKVTFELPQELNEMKMIFKAFKSASDETEKVAIPESELPTEKSAPKKRGRKPKKTAEKSAISKTDVQIALSQYATEYTANEAKAIIERIAGVKSLKKVDEVHYAAIVAATTEPPPDPEPLAEQDEFSFD